MECENVTWVKLAPIESNGRTIMNMVMNLWVS
jgi:hypothetical protein